MVGTLEPITNEEVQYVREYILNFGGQQVNPCDEIDPSHTEPLLKKARVDSGHDLHEGYFEQFVDIVYQHHLQILMWMHPHIKQIKRCKYTLPFDIVHGYYYLLLCVTNLNID